MNYKRHHSSGKIWPPALLLLWAGLSLGGNIIAAPAKFQVETLALQDLLQVGRAQFAWLGIAEIVLAVAFVGVCLLSKTRIGWAAGSALFVLCAQQVGLQPMLEARTDLILAGQPAPPSHLHLWFIVTEVFKFIALISAAVGALARTIETNPFEKG